MATLLSNPTQVVSGVFVNLSHDSIQNVQKTGAFWSTLEVRPSAGSNFESIADSRKDAPVRDKNLSNANYAARDLAFLTENYQTLARYLTELKRTKSGGHPVVRIVSSNPAATPTAAQVVLAGTLVRSQLIQAKHEIGNNIQIYNGATDSNISGEWLPVPAVEKQMDWQKEIFQAKSPARIPSERKPIEHIPHGVAETFERALRGLSRTEPRAAVVLNGVTSYGAEGRSNVNPFATNEVTALTSPRAAAFAETIQNTRLPHNGATLYTLTLYSGPLAEQAGAGAVSQIYNVVVEPKHYHAQKDHEHFYARELPHYHNQGAEHIVAGKSNPNLLVTVYRPAEAGILDLWCTKALTSPVC